MCPQNQRNHGNVAKVVMNRPAQTSIMFLSVYIVEKNKLFEEYTFQYLSVGVLIKTLQILLSLQIIGSYKRKLVKQLLDIDFYS